MSNDKLCCDVQFYCVNYKDEERKSRMTYRFKSVKIDVLFLDPVDITDNSQCHNSAMSCMLNHINSIKHFVHNSKSNYCIVCEDDIHISKRLFDDLPSIIEVYNNLKLDILLLGYLLVDKIENVSRHFQLKYKNDMYSFYDYPSDLWGTQMYLISKSHAIELINKYDNESAINSTIVPYSADWTITKYGNKALIYPMVAVEEINSSKSNSLEHIDFHNECHKLYYDKNTFV